MRLRLEALQDRREVRGYRVALVDADDAAGLVDERQILIETEPGSETARVLIPGWIGCRFATISSHDVLPEMVRTDIGPVGMHILRLFQSGVGAWRQ